MTHHLQPLPDTKSRQEVIAEAAKHAAREHGLPDEATNFYPLATAIYDHMVEPLQKELQKLRDGRECITEGMAAFGVEIEWNSEGLPSIDVSGFHKHNESAPQHHAGPVCVKCKLPWPCPDQRAKGVRQ